MKLNDALKRINKSINSIAADESPYIKPTEFLSTGSFAINRVLTGDIHKGFGVGRIHTIYGESGSGKSLLVANVIIDALKNNNVDQVYYYDTEGGMLIDYIESHGVDISRIQHKTVRFVEDCSVDMTKMYDELVTARNEYLKDPDNNDNIRTLVVLDSFGGLETKKQFTDAVEKDKMVSDQGLSAKMRNAFIRGMMMSVVQSNATMLVVNHAYQNPNQMFASKIKQMGGGLGIEYASEIILQADKVLVKSSDTEFLTGHETEDDHSGFYKGNKLKFFVRKNRTAKPCFEATMYMDFNHGMSKYDGLIEDAVKFGFLEEVRGGYVCKSYSDKKIAYKDLVASDEIWNTFIDDFNKKSIEMMQYRNGITNELDKMGIEK